MLFAAHRLQADHPASMRPVMLDVPLDRPMPRRSGLPGALRFPPRVGSFDPRSLLGFGSGRSAGSSSCGSLLRHYLVSSRFGPQRRSTPPTILTAFAESSKGVLELVSFVLFPRVFRPNDAPSAECRGTVAEATSPLGNPRETATCLGENRTSCPGTHSPCAVYRAALGVAIQGAIQLNLARATQQIRRDRGCRGLHPRRADRPFCLGLGAPPNVYFAGWSRTNGSIFPSVSKVWMSSVLDPGQSMDQAYPQPTGHRYRSGHLSV